MNSLPIPQNMNSSLVLIKYLLIRTVKRLAAISLKCAFRATALLLGLYLITGCVEEEPAILSSEDRIVAAAADPSSSLNSRNRNVLRGARVNFECRNFLRSVGRPIAGGGYGRNGKQFWRMDLFGNRASTSPYPSNPYREVFAGDNMLIECIHSQYGVLSLLIPNVEPIVDNRTAQSHRTPDWMSPGIADTTGTYQPRSTLVVSPVTDLYYRVYKIIAERELLTNESAPTAAEDLYRQAIQIASRVSGIQTPLVDEEWKYYDHQLSSGGELPGYGIVSGLDYKELATASVFEKFRVFLIQNPEFGASMSNVTTELARLLTDSSDISDGLKKKLEAAFLDKGRELTVNSNFADGLNGWTSYVTNSASPGSELFLVPREGGSTVVMNLVSNRIKDGALEQIGVFQELYVAGSAVDLLYVNASYSRIDGIQEESGFGLYEASGTASISLEYLDSEGLSIGTSHFVNTEDPLFADFPFTYNAPESLRSSIGETVVRIPEIGNTGLSINVGDAARESLRENISSLASLRVYGWVGDYIGANTLRHPLFGIVISVPECENCKAYLALDHLSVVELND